MVGPVGGDARMAYALGSWVDARGPHAKSESVELQSKESAFYRRSR